MLSVRFLFLFQTLIFRINKWLIETPILTISILLLLIYIFFVVLVNRKLLLSSLKNGIGSHFHKIGQNWPICSTEEIKIIYFYYDGRRMLSDGYSAYNPSVRLAWCVNVRTHPIMSNSLRFKQCSSNFSNVRFFIWFGIIICLLTNM